MEKWTKVICPDCCGSQRKIKHCSCMGNLYYCVKCNGKITYQEQCSTCHAEGHIYFRGLDQWSDNHLVKVLRSFFYEVDKQYKGFIKDVVKLLEKGEGLTQKQREHAFNIILEHCGPLPLDKEEDGIHINQIFDQHPLNGVDKEVLDMEELKQCANCEDWDIEEDGLCLICLGRRERVQEKIVKELFELKAKYRWRKCKAFFEEGEWPVDEERLYEVITRSGYRFFQRWMWMDGEGYMGPPGCFFWEEEPDVKYFRLATPTPQQ